MKKQLTTFLSEIKSLFFPKPELEHFIEYWNNGKVKEDGYRFKYGLLHGLLTEWYRSGEKKSEIYFENGYRIFMINYHQKTSKKRCETHYPRDRGAYKRGRVDRKIFFYETGEKEGEVNWKNGALVRETIFYKSGITKRVKHIKNRSENKVFWIESEWDEEGNKISDEKKEFYIETREEASAFHYEFGWDEQGNKWDKGSGVKVSKEKK